jgi:hypothetical protein
LGSKGGEVRLVIELNDHGEVPEGVVTFGGEGSSSAFYGWLELAALVERAHARTNEQESDV